MVNKAMWDIDRSERDLIRFKGDPLALLADWEARATRPEPPYPAGGTLTDEERAALANRDYGALYAMGANPYLLWQFARSVSVPEIELENLISSFREAVEPHGRPDFHT
jgi:hypothetical protein